MDRSADWVSHVAANTNQQRARRRTAPRRDLHKRFRWLLRSSGQFRKGHNHPLLITKVNYVSPKEREDQLKAGLGEWARITCLASLSHDRLHLAAYSAFNFVKVFSLTTKHCGFAEEQEWRVVYVPERDPLGYLKPMLDYLIGPRGVEPKLKYKLGSAILKPQSGSGDDLVTGALSDILEFIILGPSVSSPLARSSFVRMLQRIKKGHFSDHVFPSTIPLRPLF
jgi:hypothetical protein